jgi:hypothetical protein
MAYFSVGQDHVRTPCPDNAGCAWASPVRAGNLAVPDPNDAPFSLSQLQGDIVAATVHCTAECAQSEHAHGPASESILRPFAERAVCACRCATRQLEGAREQMPCWKSLAMLMPRAAVVHQSQQHRSVHTPSQRTKCSCQSGSSRHNTTCACAGWTSMTTSLCWLHGEPLRLISDEHAFAMQALSTCSATHATHLGITLQGM